jgi:hypothetical protein
MNTPGRHRLPWTISSAAGGRLDAIGDDEVDNRLSNKRSPAVQNRANTSDTAKISFLPDPLDWPAIQKFMTALGMAIPPAAISATETKICATGGEFVRVRGHTFNPIVLDRALADRTTLSPEKRIALKVALNSVGLLA